MSVTVGQGSLGIVSKTIPNGAPFPTDAAECGLHVDAINGRIKLGSDPFGPNPKPFNENVILDSNLFNFVIIDLPTGLQYIQLFPLIQSAKFGVLDFANIYFDGSGSVFIVSKPGGGAPVRRVFLADPTTQSVLIGDVDLQDTIPVFLTFDSLNGVANLLSNLFDVSNNALNAGYSVNGNAGASGTFTTADAKTVTVEGGIITSIV